MQKVDGKHVTAGELAHKAASDSTKYDALEVGYYMSESIEGELYKSIALHKNIIDEPEFCVVMLIGKDPLIPNLIRRKFYCWPFLPKPRPNQSVFLYNKDLDRITKRLWVLPSDVVMAELASTDIIVDKRYQTLQAWSVAFFKGTFWEYVRYDQKIDMLSETEYLQLHREELLKAGCQMAPVGVTEPFDFSKISVNHIVDTQTAHDFEGSEDSGRKRQSA